MLAARLLVCLLIFGVAGLRTSAAQTAAVDAAADRARRHQTDEWLLVAPHLPDPQTGTPQQLQLAGDILRARRMPEDALEYYQFAAQQGGDAVTLTNRVGLTWLELRRPDLAEIAFRKVVRLQPREGQGWNNLGASEYIRGELRAAIADYSKAVKLAKKTAVFRSNLGTAYFEAKDYESARKQFALAIKLDPGVYQGGSLGGVQAHVLSPSDRGRYCFEMAKVAAKVHDGDNMLLWLARASETGFEIRAEMAEDRDLRAYAKDPRVMLIVHNAHALRNGQVAESIPLPVAATVSR